MKTALAAAIIFVVAGALPASAQSQQEMNREAQDEASAADRELNEVYKRVIGGLDEEQAALLKAAQRAWLAYRDAEAKFAADEMRGGSAAPMLYSGTVAGLTKERIRRLQEYLKEDEEEPAGAQTSRKAAEVFFNAYVRHDRGAASEVASAGALDELNWDASAGKAEGLRLVDPTHIAYEGGSMELTMRKNASGRWYVSGLTMTAD